MNKKDTYNTLIEASTEIIYKDKNSKFFGYAYPITKIDEVKTYIDILKKQHHNAGHWCYAYQLGTEQVQYRANDDGEPNNSAGQPIYGQIQSYKLTNVLVVIVRYFGGVKLGVAGLINAYKTSAKMALENASIIEKTINVSYRIMFDYKNMSKVMRIIKEKNITIINQKLELDCSIDISVRKRDSEVIFNIFNTLFEIRIKKYTD